MATANPRPDTIVLELCSQRTGLLSNVDNSSAVKGERGVLEGSARAPPFQQFLELALASFQDDGVEVADDMQAAVAAAKSMDIPQSRIVLGDRRISHTMASWAQAAGWGERAYLFVDVVLNRIRQPQSEKAASSSAIAHARGIICRRAPAMYRALYAERELHLAWAARDSPAALQAKSIALVCGRAHVDAIKNILMEGCEIDIARLEGSTTIRARSQD
jgi:pheromone shutdown protein TraB